MPILTCTLGQLLAMTGINDATLRSDRLRNYSVAAFGAARPVVDARCLLADGMAMRIHNDLSGMLHRRAAAVVTRAFWPEWAEALARIEHRGEPVLFALGQLRDTVWWCGAGHADELPKFVAQQPPMRRLLTVNIARHKFEMEERAKMLCLDLSRGSFILAPDDARFVEWMTEFRQARDRAQARFDPLHLRAPRAPSARLRRSVAEATCPLQ
jgi:hypothetical protein